MQRLAKIIPSALSMQMSWHAIVLLLVAATMVSLGCQKAQESTGESHVATASSTTATEEGRTVVTAGLPRLLDLGADKCIPCKMMAPILDELKDEFAGQLDVVFIDVWQDKEGGAKYDIQSIPTQIFFDANGKELFRHEGFFGREEILAKWKELGVDLKTSDSSSSSLESES